MIKTDFFNQPYVAEVLRTRNKNAAVSDALERLIIGRWKKESAEGDRVSVVVHHGLVPSLVPYHRSRRVIKNERGEEVEIPQVRKLRGQDHFLYDLLVVERGRHVIVAVPFHALAKWLFVKVDKILAGTRTEYETLNITNMVIQLGVQGRISRVTENQTEVAIVVTRCHLAYSDPIERKHNLEQVRLTGANLGATEIYPQLVDPVVNPKPKGTDLNVTPILLGFALMSDNVKKSGAISDRHGNFKVSVGPGLRQITRLFQLLDEIEQLEDVVSKTSNVPILQSGSIEGVE
jgi:hypothetical protein